MEAPSVEEAHARFKDKVAVVGVAWAGDEQSYADFIARHSLTFGNIDDTDGEVFSRYSVPFQPAWVFVSRSGEVRKVQGALDESSLESALNDLASS